jgi:hypothetical protein
MLADRDFEVPFDATLRMLARVSTGDPGVPKFSDLGVPLNRLTAFSIAPNLSIFHPEESDPFA